MTTKLSSRRHVALAMAAISVLILMIIMIAYVTGVTQYGGSMVATSSSTMVNAESTILKCTIPFGPRRKLLLLRDDTCTLCCHQIERRCSDMQGFGYAFWCINCVAGGARILDSSAAAQVEVQPNRIWGDKCSNSDIVINQGPTSPLPSGIPTYTVEIMNVCTTGCNISGIHVSCGWFSSARLINPRRFKRLRYNDCLVNDGKPLINGRTISFQYANTFPYPLSISSVVC